MGIEVTRDNIQTITELLELLEAVAKIGNVTRVEMTVDLYDGDTYRLGYGETGDPAVLEIYATE